MYVSYFNLSEPPFSITPDPRFVYLSGRHREALAHLLYGVGAGGGFVVLTGEVGTGKTTVCRYLLDHLPKEVDVALILNPRVTAVELIAAVCDELRVPYPAGTDSLKVLVDALSQRLLETHGKGRRTVLIVDEAQNLGVEVLEQVRLLTNLETPKEKLLQIILIGQPELLRLLERRELRQLAQRITARYHLMPFAEPETRAYIAHRLRVAGTTEPLFEARAIREIHRRSRGVPRLINVMCDRALLGAFAGGLAKADAAVVRRAAAEVLGDESPRRRLARRLSVTAAALVFAAGVGLVAAYVAPRVGGAVAELWWRHATPSLVPAPAANAPAPASPAAAGPESGAPAALVAAVPSDPRPEPRPAGPRLARLLSDAAVDSDRGTAFETLYARWGVAYRRGDDAELACDAARRFGLRCAFKRGTWTMLRRLDVPAVLELAAPTGARRYATVTALDDAGATLAFGTRAERFSLREIEEHWDGGFVVAWRPPALTAVPIAPGARGRDVTWLRRRLAEIDGGDRRDGDVYDDELRARVLSFQRRQALSPDGVVGEETLIRLTAVGDATAPSLARAAR